MKHLRFEDRFPPTDLFIEHPSWTFASDGTRRGVDESTLKPAVEQRYIDPNRVRYTAADAWLPDGKKVSALIRVNETVPLVGGLVMFVKGEEIWLKPHGKLRGRWRIEGSNEALPLRFASRLSIGKVDGPLIQGVVETDGSMREPTADDLIPKSKRFASAPKTIGSERTAKRVWKDLGSSDPASSGKPYTPRSKFSVDDVLAHAKFGRGFVRKVSDEGWIEVLFEEGLKRLAHNRPQV